VALIFLGVHKDTCNQDNFRSLATYLTGPTTSPCDRCAAASRPPKGEIETARELRHSIDGLVVVDVLDDLGDTGLGTPHEAETSHHGREDDKTQKARIAIAAS
jgi:hypothetical protein